MLTQILTSLNPFAKPKADDIANTMFEDYRRKFLEHEESAAYNAKMAEYYKEGMKRLSAHRA